MLTVQDGEPLPHPCPEISKRTIPMAGILVDVYGLAELHSNPSGKVACLWLHHARTRRKETMGDFACRSVSAWNKRREELVPAPHSSSSDGDGKGKRPAAAATGDRGLIALAFDHRNHGTRLVDERANGAWRAGNERHATDMMGMISGMVEDTRGLMDVVEGYLLADHGGGEDEDKKGEEVVEMEVDMHLVCGKSLGGHSAWQMMFREERVEAGVIIVGCPDYMHLLTDRARLTKLPTYIPDSPSSFLGSRHFPKDLVTVCRQRDPKGILFGTDSICGPSPSAEERARLRSIFDSTIRGKKFFICSGGEDKLVPYRMSAPFMDFFEGAVDKENGWYKEGEVEVWNRLYEGVGHTFSDGMARDAVAFLVEVLERGPKGGWKERSRI